VLRIVVVAIYSRVWTIRWWLVVGGASRHLCNKDRSVYSSKCVESRCVQPLADLGCDRESRGSPIFFFFEFFLYIFIYFLKLYYILFILKLYYGKL